ncbi:MAG: formylglycine-generating enzyme family protein [Polyangiaceae bacterium]|nr:formylglycine-generating enzyme family protein [Polyangiaceae bacterium]MCB9607902.1 formylglycine-generating enzyme family protein [Polyangiaceae bacterium]
MRPAFWPRVGALGCLVWCLSGCGEESLPPRGQAVLYVNTDAPLPNAAGDEASELIPLFDRLMLEVFPPGSDSSCQGCTRELAASTEVFQQGVSFGLVGEPGTRVRARLFKSTFLLGDEPRPESTLEAVTRLPKISEGSVQELHVDLLVDSLGTPLGSLSNPHPAEPGRGAPEQVGSWWGARRLNCPTEPGEDEVCVPGGAFWMGDPRLDFSGSPEHDGSLERLVVASPFFVEKHELTVAAFRASGLERRRLPTFPVDDPHEQNTGIPGCTYTPEPSETDQLSVNCITWSLADEYCRSVGKSLPSEAQLEYLLSGLGRGSFVWGNTPPSCEDAVFERSLGGDCYDLGAGVQAAGSGLRDRLVLQSGELLDIAGNVSEWARDEWDPENGSCWGTGLFVDPLCVKGEPDPELATHSYRGGHFGDVVNGLRSAVRGSITNAQFAAAPEIGVRCARTP